MGGGGEDDSEKGLEHGACHGAAMEGWAKGDGYSLSWGKQGQLWVPPRLLDCVFISASSSLWLTRSQESGFESITS